MVVNPEPAPAVAVAPPPPPLPTQAPADWRPLKPNARKGRVLLGTTVVLGAATWGLAIGQIALAQGCPQKIRIGSGEATISECLFADDTMLAGVGALRGLANVGNWGVAAAAGGVRGNYDAIEHVWGDRAPRRHRAWIGAGVALTVGGMLTGALSSAAYGQGCLDPDRCYQQLATYILVGQAAQSMFTAGIGMFTYGIVYGHEYRDNRRYVGRRVSVTPRFGPRMAGASLSAKF